MTPLMQQYWDLKNSDRAQGALLFFRMGDFYELFGQDAEDAHALLGITLTTREKSADAPKMAGVPHHSADQYLERLLNAGRKVAIAEQMEAPDGKGPVRREIVRVLTPGVRLGLQAGEGVYTAWWSPEAFVAIDSGTGDTLVEPNVDFAAIPAIAAQINVQHLLVSSPRGMRPEFRELPFLVEEATPSTTPTTPETLLRDLQRYLLANHAAPGASHLRPPRPLRGPGCLGLSAAALQHLDVLPGSSPLNVFETLRKTKTAMGSRLFRRWLASPLTDPTAIHERQQFVTLFSEPEVLATVPKALAEIYDLERLSARIALRVASMADLLALRISLEAAERLRFAPSLSRHLSMSPAVREVLELLLKALTEDANFSQGYDPELDRVLDLTERGAEHLLNLEAAERARTGIPTLKVKYHRSFGYFYEISKSHLTKVPQDYVRRQSMVGAERFSNAPLEQLAVELLSAETQKRERESTLFSQLLDRLESALPEIARLSDQIANLDVLLSLATLLHRPGWKMPVIDNGSDLEFVESRHPLLADSGQFVPNSLKLSSRQRALLITGPNMGGKSTLMRQVGLSVILGQVGAPIPVERARWGAYDRLHTRIGAHDSLERGQSTFMVEMSELSSILGSATDRSLVILDEIGRGTSTFDGLSVAWATLEWLCAKTHAKILCSTHYHELTELSKTQPALANAHVTVEETDGRLRFLYKLAEGPASESFGIHVAKLAGLPEEIIDRAWELLEKLERTEAPIKKPSRPPGLRVGPAQNQLSLFSEKAGA